MTDVTTLIAFGTSSKRVGLEVWAPCLVASGNRITQCNTIVGFGSTRYAYCSLLNSDGVFSSFQHDDEKMPCLAFGSVARIEVVFSSARVVCCVRTFRGVLSSWQKEYHHWTCLFVVQSRKTRIGTDMVSFLQDFKSSTAGPVQFLRASYLQ